MLEQVREHREKAVVWSVSSHRRHVGVGNFQPWKSARKGAVLDTKAAETQGKGTGPPDEWD